MCFNSDQLKWVITLGTPLSIMVMAVCVLHMLDWARGRSYESDIMVYNFARWLDRHQVENDYEGAAERFLNGEK